MKPVRIKATQPLGSTADSRNVLCTSDTQNWDPTSNTSVVGNSDPAVTVESHGCHFTRTSRSVFVVPVVSRHRVVVIVVDIRAGMLVLQQTGPRISANW